MIMTSATASFQFTYKAMSDVEDLPLSRTHVHTSLDPRPFWPHAKKSLGNNLARKCLECWNAAVGVDEGKNAFQPTSVEVLLITGSEYRT